MPATLVPYVFDAFTACIAKDHGMSEVAVGGEDLAATLGYGATAPTVDDLSSLVRLCSANSGVAVTAELTGFYADAAELAFCVRKLARSGAGRIIASPAAAQLQAFLDACADAGVAASMKLPAEHDAAYLAIIAENPDVEVIGGAAEAGAAWLRAATPEEAIAALAAVKNTASRVYISGLIRDVSVAAVRDQLATIRTTGQSGDQKRFYDARLRKESLIGLSKMLELEKRTVEKSANA